MSFLDLGGEHKLTLKAAEGIAGGGVDYARLPRLPSRRSSGRCAALESGFNYDLVCIGSGPAGQRAAVRAAKLGRRVALIERRRGVGGACCGTGTIPSKTFREAVLSFTGRSSHAAAGGGFGSSRAGNGGGPRPRARLGRAAAGGGFGSSRAGTGGRPSARELLSRVAEVVGRESALVENQLERNDVDLL